MSDREGDHGVRRAPPLCETCQKPTVFVTTIPKATQPGQVSMFQCETCERLTFIDT
jgi:hypothetical protein